MKKYLITSESVTEGHPDKVCDYISDKILDECLIQDPDSRVAVDSFVVANKVVVGGQITSRAKINIENIVRECIKKIGYNNANTDMDYRTCEVDIQITKQSEDIALGTNNIIGGAGDQGIMFGFAIDETPEYMPFGVVMAHKLSKKLSQVRKEKILPYIRPDGKTQVTVEYDGDKIKRIDSVIISTQHTANVNLETLKKDIKKEIIDVVIPIQYLDKNTKCYINPTGRFIIGGPLGDTGLTGRKIIVDTYGGYARHGGGAFSGKDATKVDRSGAYMLRHIAKNIVANKFAKKCEIQISYAIGIKEPMSIYINTFGTGIISDQKIINIIKKRFDLTPQGIIKYLDLNKPIYTKTTNYGHFGKNNLSWEKIVDLNI